MKQQTSTVNEENEEFMLHCLVSCRDIVRNLQESLSEPFFSISINLHSWNLLSDARVLIKMELKSRVIEKVIKKPHEHVVTSAEIREKLNLSFSRIQVFPNFSLKAAAVGLAMTIVLQLFLQKQEVDVANKLSIRSDL